jgi:hypothetical protein
MRLNIEPTSPPASQASGIRNIREMHNVLARAAMPNLARSVSVEDFTGSLVVWALWAVRGRALTKKQRADSKK